MPCSPQSHLLSLTTLIFHEPSPSALEVLPQLPSLTHLQLLFKPDWSSELRGIKTAHWAQLSQLKGLRTLVMKDVRLEQVSICVRWGVREGRVMEGV